MTTLAANLPRSYSLAGVEDIGERPCVATDIVYEGAAVGLSSGNGRPLVAGDVFDGFASEKCDNSTGSAGDVRIKLKRRGYAQLAVTGVTAITDVGSTVYASDDNTFTLSSTGNSAIGKVDRFVSTGVAIVYFEAGSLRSI